MGRASTGNAAYRLDPFLPKGGTHHVRVHCRNSRNSLCIALCFYWRWQRLQRNLRSRPQRSEMARPFPRVTQPRAFLADRMSPCRSRGLTCPKAPGRWLLTASTGIRLPTVGFTGWSSTFPPVLKFCLRVRRALRCFRRAPRKELENTFGTTGWEGPLPTRGSGTHPYEFQLCALSVETLNLPVNTNLASFNKAIEGKVLATAKVVGTYER
jgi:hypothetical protein